MSFFPPDDPEEGEFKIIDPKDFESLKIKIKALNTTTNVEVRTSGKKEIVIAEFTPDGFILELPEKSCSIGHNLTIHFTATLMDNRLDFQTTAKVESTENLSDGQDRVDVRMLQYIEEDWQKFQEIYTERQKQIIEFLEAANG